MMTFLRFLLLWLGASFASFGAPQADLEIVKATPAKPLVLTWPQCVALTTANNPDLQASREGVLNSDAVRRGAYSSLFPQISASFNTSRSYNAAYLSAPSNYATAYGAQLSVSQKIFDGFATKGSIDQTRAQLSLAFANLNSQKAAVSFDLKSAFVQLLYAQQLLDLSRGVIKIREKTFREVKLLYQGGSEDKGAMLLSQANLDQASNDLSQAQRTFDLSGLQLCVVIGRDLGAPIQATGELKTGDQPEKPNFRELALHTPAYLQDQARADAAAAGITISNSGWYPSIFANGSYSRSGSDFPPQQQGLSGGISVSIPLFEGGQTYFNVKAAHASLRQALADLRSGTDQASLTLAQAFKSMIDAENNVPIQEELLAATELRYKIAVGGYNNGLVTFQDFNTITDNYVSQQQACLSSQRDAVIAEANWEQARGLGAIP